MTWELEEAQDEEVLQMAAEHHLEHLAAVREARARLYAEMADDYEWMEEQETWQ